MNKRIKKLWLKALRSGKFKQANGAMREEDPDGYKGYAHCCLGVLEQIRCDETGKKFRENDSLLAPVTMKWAGLTTDDPILAPRKQTYAAEMNDDGKSFKFIADRIEKYL